MNKLLSIRAVAITLFVALAVSYMLRIFGDVLYGLTMDQVWEPLLPGFNWPVAATSLFVGLPWLVGYSLFVATILVLPYKYATQRLVTTK